MSRHSILIVDDDVVTRKALSLILRKKGYETLTADTGQAALDKAREQFFNVAILDINLPDVQGLELIKPLRAMRPDIVLIMLSAHATLENSMKALNKGASAYLTKPVNVDEMLVKVREGIEKQRLTIENRRLSEDVRKELEERRAIPG